MTFVSDSENVSYYSDTADIAGFYEENEDIPAFEKAGPRQMIYHNPAWCRAAILTAGGLCPGLNEVIKFLTITLTRDYGVNDVFYSYVPSNWAAELYYRHCRQVKKVLPESDSS